MKIVREIVESHVGGVNRAVTDERMSPTELAGAENGRDRIHGAVTKRSGSQRIHDTGIGTRVDGFQWEPASGVQDVGVADGSFWYKGVLDTDYTEIVAGLSTTNRARFAVHRKDGNPSLYVADGTGLWQFDGSNIVSVPGAGVLNDIAVYKTRMWGIRDKFAVASAVDDPTKWSQADGALAAVIETYSSAPLRGLARVGGSLLFFKEDNVSRYIGTTAANTTIEPSGLSGEVGLIAPRTLVRVEDVAFFLTDRGPYLASEQGVREIGFKVRPEFDFADRDLWADAVAAHNRRRKEIWLFVPEPGGTQNTVGWVWNYETKAWWGPWRFSFPISDAWRYERPTGQESVALSCYDGFVRDGDVDAVGAKDDVLRDGTGGTNIKLQVTYPPKFFEHPHRTKLGGLNCHVRADLGVSGELDLRFVSDNRDRRVTIPSRADRVEDYAFRPSFRGREVQVIASEYSSEITRIDSLKLKARLGRQTS